MKRVMALIGLLALSVATNVNAEVSDEEFQQLKQMLEQTQERLNQLEAQQAAVDTVQQAEVVAEAEVELSTAEQVAANTAKLDKMSWANRIRWQGDFRYRYQPEETSGRTDPPANTPYEKGFDDASRNRQRIRARAAMIADVGDDVEVGFGLATGGDNPVSANATLGGAGARPEIRLDLAYFDWGLADNWNLVAGKFKNINTDVGKAALLRDGDWRPEGIDLRYKGGFLYANAMGTWLGADSSDGSGNTFSYSAQVGIKPELAGMKMDIGASYWKIKSKGLECYDDDGGVGDNCFGNTQVSAATGQVDATATDNVYASDYAPVELYAKAVFGDTLPIGVFADYVKNIDAEAIPAGSPSAGKKLDTAYAAGAWVGRGKKNGEWQVKAYYMDREADSVLGLLTDSDFAGGGADNKGYIFEGKYMLTNTTYLKAKYLAAERQDSNGYESGALNTIDPYDVDILQLDIQFKYK
jgi:hypothetical protein